MKQIWLRFYKAEVDLESLPPNWQHSDFTLTLLSVLPLTDSALLAKDYILDILVLWDNISPQRLALCDTREEGPYVSSSGDNISSLAWAVEHSFLAPEEYQLRDTRLYSEVIETIVFARAPLRLL